MNMSFEQTEQFERENTGTIKKTRTTDEIDLQELFENYNFHTPLDPREFSSAREWWYGCRICGGETKLSTKHPYCRHCGFSPKN